MGWASVGLRYICPGEGEIHSRQFLELRLTSHTLLGAQDSLWKDRGGGGEWDLLGFLIMPTFSPKEELLPGFVQRESRSGLHSVRAKISAEKDTKESVKLEN